MSLLPRAEGLYDPRHEHDACGVGFIANQHGARSHALVRKALEILINLEHRGACGCDPLTGDGAGILLQIPHGFFQAALRELGVALPDPGEYGVASLFLPRAPDQRKRCMEVLERAVAAQGQTLLGWRRVPTDHRHIGPQARTVEPEVWQLFVRRGPETKDADALERALYLIRRVAERAVAATQMPQRAFFYVCSFSGRTIVYKGLLLAEQIEKYYPDLAENAVESALAIVHQRFSTNTFPTWDLAHPFRYLCHNGEINTLRGNLNWMRARQTAMTSPLFGDDLKKCFPVIREGQSDSACLDNAFELLVLAGRSLAHAAMMLIPEAWSDDVRMDPARRGFYEYHACLQEPWDGPAAIAFTDGRAIGATLDRNGLRPARYFITQKGHVILASEVGVLDIPEEDIVSKGRLQPGRIFMVDTERKRIIGDEELKQQVCSRQPYAEWVRDNKIELAALPQPPGVTLEDHDTIVARQNAFGYTAENLRVIIAPMVENGEEPVGSMGVDTPLAVLSERPRLLYDYFKQLFAQVTNPPIDPVRESLVMSLEMYIGGEANLLAETPAHARQIDLPQPVLRNFELEALRHSHLPHYRPRTLSALMEREDGAPGLVSALDRLADEAGAAIREGCSLIVLTDRGVDERRAPIPALLAVAAVHHHLVRQELRTQAALVVESGEPREVNHFALLIAYGASAVNPYLAFETIADMHRARLFPEGMDLEQCLARYIKAVGKGLLKIMSKMGISTLQSYHGAEIYEAVGLADDVMARYFTTTASRIGGIGLDELAQEALERHSLAFPRLLGRRPGLDPGGEYQWRRDGEAHLKSPDAVALLQQAVRGGNGADFGRFSAHVNDPAAPPITLRALLDFREGVQPPAPLDEVEPAAEIVKRFATGAMSFGSISKEAHENLAIAMNRIGGRSNTGEGGEDPRRFTPDANGDRRRSAIKQVASARFGVTSEYLCDADELQIKMAQGAKPGEGGQLPGHKVDRFIAEVRHATPGVGLITPAPHHDIYSIDDLAQLFFDLTNANSRARIS
ncbi:MAG: glutamate synthase large subunit, partial [Planctomycetes bacterium]|nr:glutamate synthase large subunit [Planctomycetota bacterium]